MIPVMLRDPFSPREDREAESVPTSFTAARCSRKKPSSDTLLPLVERAMVTSCLPPSQISAMQASALAALRSAEHSVQLISHPGSPNGPTGVALAALAVTVEAVALAPKAAGAALVAGVCHATEEMPERCLRVFDEVSSWPIVQKTGQFVHDNAERLHDAYGVSAPLLETATYDGMASAVGASLRMKAGKVAVLEPTPPGQAILKKYAGGSLITERESSVILLYNELQQMQLHEARIPKILGFYGEGKTPRFEEVKLPTLHDQTTNFLRTREGLRNLQRGYGQMGKFAAELYRKSQQPLNGEQKLQYAKEMKMFFQMLSDYSERNGFRLPHSQEDIAHIIQEFQSSGAFVGLAYNRLHPTQLKFDPETQWLHLVNLDVKLSIHAKGESLLYFASSESVMTDLLVGIEKYGMPQMASKALQEAFLTGYLGMFESSRFSPFFGVLEQYKQAYRAIIHASECGAPEQGLEIARRLLSRDARKYDPLNPLNRE